MYDELIAILDDLDVALDNGFGKASTFIACTKATRKVIELHKPKEYKVLGTFTDGLIQTGCACGGRLYPCPTIQVIAEELK
jgi:hypothetical protein